jgi:nucleoside-diphosphate-sugar epimerase
LPGPSTLALVGASSQIARDLTLSLARRGPARLLLYVRDQPAQLAWLEAQGLRGRCEVSHYDAYGREPHQAVINFVGVGDPARAAAMGGSILDLTQAYDDLVLGRLGDEPGRRYLFLSSGAAYGGGFGEPAGDGRPARFDLNALRPQDFYGVAKLHAEAKHRARPGQAITDLRVFSYFSRTQDLGARYFITDIVRAIRDGVELECSGDPMVRDYLHPDDFRQLVEKVLEAPPANRALDCYSRSTVDKAALLAAMQQRFGLRYRIGAAASAVDATGSKAHYYSLSRAAAALGYEPAHGSLDGILAETAAILGRA